MPTVKRIQHESSKEKLILTGMVLSSEVLQQVQFLHDVSAFPSKYAQTVSTWCLDYFASYGRAPRTDIQEIFEERRMTMEDQEAGLIEDLLRKLSSEYEASDGVNSPYIVDQAEMFFKRAGIKKAATNALKLLEADDLIEAEREMVEFSTVERPQGGWINPYTDSEAIDAAFESKQDPLFTFPSAFGHMVNRQLTRGSFMALLGVEKIGKTWILDLFATQAGKHRCNVAFFSVGDMTQEDMIIRKATGLTGIISDDDWVDVIYNRPREFIEREDTREGNFGLPGWDVVIKEEKQTRLLTASEAKRAGRAFARNMTGKDFRLFTLPNDTVNVHYIEAQLDIMEAMEGWCPDVIVIDYADILAPEPGSSSDFRHQQNKTWKALRALAQKRFCFVLTATQADAAAYGKIGYLKRSNFSEDKRKLAHVTAMLGLNQTEDEKIAGVMRVNWIALRSGHYIESKMCHMLQCLPIGRPLLGSAYLKIPERHEESDD